MANNFGPDNQQALNGSLTQRIDVPSGRFVRFRFSFNAANENAAIIYLADSLTRAAERGNYSRSDADFFFHNTTSHTISFLITGWHKNTPPSGGQPWFQSPKHVFVSTPLILSVGFEDQGGGTDFDDALVTVNL